MVMDQCQSHTKQDLGSLVEQAVPYSKHCLKTALTIIDCNTRLTQINNISYLILTTVHRLQTLISFHKIISLSCSHLNWKDVDVKADEPS